MQDNMSHENNAKRTPSRPSWDEYFLSIVDAVSARAGCDRGRSGCIIVKENRILVTGYVGSPSGAADCYQEGHQLAEMKAPSGLTTEHCIRTIHAEQNAIAQAARFGIALQGATLYCTMLPCYNCAKLIVATGISEVISRNNYHAGDLTLDLFRSTGVKLHLHSLDNIHYPK